MTDPAILEAAARALLAVQEDWTLERAAKWLAYYDEEMASYTKEATAVLAAVAPLIRAATLEEAAQRIEADDEDYLVRNEVAAMIRALIPASPSPSADSA